MSMRKIVASFLVVFMLAGTTPTRAFAQSRSPASLGLIAGIFALVLGAAYFIGREKESTDRTAITEGNRTKRESIRAGAVLSAPRALGGSGSASYSSSEGDAKIQADSNLAGGGPPRKPYGTEAEEEQRDSYAERKSIVELPSVRTLEALYDNLEQYSPSEGERRALYSGIEEARDPSQARFDRGRLRRYLDELNTLQDRVLRVGASVEQVAELEKLIKYLEVAVFGRRIS